MRILIAGVGNVLRGDDAFGIEVLHHLEQSLAVDGVEFFESGIAGISLVQKLMDGWEALILVDALDRGGMPGQVFVLEPDLDSLGKEAGRGDPVDLHQADPAGVLRLASALQVLPKHVWIVGCQAVGCDDLGAPLSGPVARAIPETVEHVHRLVEGLATEKVYHAAQ